MSRLNSTQHSASGSSFNSSLTVQTCQTDPAEKQAAKEPWRPLKNEAIRSSAPQSSSRHHHRSRAAPSPSQEGPEKVFLDSKRASRHRNVSRSRAAPTILKEDPISVFLDTQKTSKCRDVSCSRVAPILLPRFSDGSPSPEWLSMASCSQTYCGGLNRWLPGFQEACPAWSCLGHPRSCSCSTELCADS